MNVWVLSGWEDVEGVYASLAAAMRAAPAVKSWYREDIENEELYTSMGDVHLRIIRFGVEDDANGDQPLPAPVFQTKITPIERTIVRFPDPISVDLVDFAEWQVKADAYAAEHNGQAGQVYFERREPNSCHIQVCCFRMALCPRDRHLFKQWEIDGSGNLRLAEFVPL